MVGDRVNPKVEAALTAHARRKAKPVVLAETTIRLTQDAIKVKKSGDLAITRAEDADPNAATLLVFDPKIGAFRPVLTPPGTSWELVQKQQGPGLWTPGKPT